MTGVPLEALGIRRTLSQRLVSVRRGGCVRLALACVALLVLGCVALLVLASAGCGGEEAAPAVPEPAPPFRWPEGPHPVATIHVAGKGAIEVELYPELAPRTTENFISLARRGFYAGTTFHRVIPGFMVQGGDPNSRNTLPGDDGEGDPGYTIPDEFSSAPHERGVLAMANAGRPDSGGCQFFVVHQDSRHLDGAYSVFGRTLSGLATLDAIAGVERDEYGRWGPKDRPLENVVIERIDVRMPGEAPESVTPPGEAEARNG